VYGVHGYGRGHAARAQAVLPTLCEQHDVLVLAGDDAWDQLHRDFPVARIPTLRYYHNRRGKRSAALTIRRNVPGLLDMAAGGPVCQMVADTIRRFAPDVVISDSEGWTHRAARRLGIPRISFDHYGIMAWCRLEITPWQRFVCRLESRVYRRLVCSPDRIIVVAFYDGQPRRAGVQTVGAILREAVRQTQPTDGDDLLAYFSNAAKNFTPAVERALHEVGVPVKVYGPDRAGTDGNVTYCPTGNLPFVRDLAGCRAVFSTAGNQLISEAIHFGKPLLLMPEEALEQRLNAQFVERWGIGLQTRPRRVTAELLRSFLARRDEFAARVRAHQRDGLPEAIDAINRAIEELT